MMTVADTVNRMKAFFSIDCELEQMPFQDWASLPRTMRGVYVLTDEASRVIYVGKGFIRSRQDSHWPKAHGTPKQHHIDPKGWKWLRENYSVTPSLWTLNYISLKKETELSAMEGGLIHLLQPLANDETFKDLNG
jgi:excinuclease UvrABC nuclease subunit